MICTGLVDMTQDQCLHRATTRRDTRSHCGQGKMFMQQKPHNVSEARAGSDETPFMIRGDRT